MRPLDHVVDHLQVYDTRGEDLGQRKKMVQTNRYLTLNPSTGTFGW